MIGLTLIACHMLGDFVLANRWMAAQKLHDWRWRTYHVAVYCLPFIPVAFVLAPWPRALVFLEALCVLHWLTDCRRFRSTLGDFIEWYYLAGRRLPLPNRVQLAQEVVRGKGVLRANPWEPIPLLIDQSLHLAQLAALGWLLT